MTSAAGSKFVELFGSTPDLIVRSPGRVNLIGDHTDYNDGLVLPMAIDRQVTIALRQRDDRVVRVFSEHADSWNEFSLESLGVTVGWSAYVEGVAHVLLQDHALSGWEGVIMSDLPVGAGLSSSAALELAVAMAFTEVSDVFWEPDSMALAAQRAEREWVGVDCGIMDQFVSAAATQGAAMYLDCRSLEYRPVPIPDNVAVVVLDSGTRRELIDSEYNARRDSCQAVAVALGVPALRDLDLVSLQSGRGSVTLVDYRRAVHVVNENEAVRQAVLAFESGDVERVGSIMNRSHDSMRDDFEVSTPEIDTMVEIAQSEDGCFGARLTGAGFGGAAVALVDRDHSSSFQDLVLHRYTSATGIKGDSFVSAPARGTSRM